MGQSATNWRELCLSSSTLRTKGSVIHQIWPQLIVIIIYNTVVVCLHLYVFTINFPVTLISVLAIVIGLLLVFRTNTAYDRYWEGRRIWSNMKNFTRNLTRSIWLGVKDRDDPTLLIEKVTAINLLIGFTYATKNYLREEYALDSDLDIRELTSHIPPFKSIYMSRVNGPPSTSAAEIQCERTTNVLPSAKSVSDSDEERKRTSVKINIPSKDGDVETRNSGKTKARITMSTRRRSAADKQSYQMDAHFYNKAHDCVTPTNIPLDISYYILSYIYSVMDRNMVDSTTLRVLIESVNQLTDCLTQFERILRTPMPLAYSIHLHQAVWLYILSLPFQLVGQLDWFTIPAVGIASFALLGILAIGSEIENPFGYDDNDLPLDDYCEVLKQEIRTIMAHKLPNPSDWIFSPDNHPFFPATYETADELNKKSFGELQNIISRITTTDFYDNPGYIP